MVQLLEMLPPRLHEYENLLTNNRIWMARTKGVGYLDAEDAIAIGVSGSIAPRQWHLLRCSQGVPLFQL